MYDHTNKPKQAALSVSVQTPKLTPEQIAVERQHAEFLTLQRQKQMWMAGFKQTVTPQREALTPVLSAGKLRNAH